MWTSAKQIRAAFDSLVADGYSLAVESDAGIAGTVAYRSPTIWLSFEWDRSEPWLTVSFAGIAPASVFWTFIDHAVTGREHPEYEANVFPSAPISMLKAFVNSVLPLLDERLASGDAVFVSRIRELEAEHRRELAAIRASRVRRR